jgi:UDP-glucose 4-epimerase
VIGIDNLNDYYDPTLKEKRLEFIFARDNASNFSFVKMDISGGLIGENPSDTPNNIMPYIVQVAKRALPELIIFGNNYATADGTGVRDYIHVEDLSEGHFVALNQLSKRDQAYDVFNLGAGRGFSVLELISAFEHVSGCKVHFKIGDIRPGDVGTCFASIHKAKVKLKWQARELFMICVGLHGILKLAKNK